MSALTQHTDEWLEDRKKFIGASDAPVIMEVSPWKTPFQLWTEKVSPEINRITSPAMQRGNDLEEKARQHFEEMTGIIMFPNCVKIHTDIPFMRASLDGIDIEEANIVEIKCPNRVDHAMAQSGKVPEKYVPQLQHQLEVCQLDMAYYFSFDGEKGVIVKVYRDETYIKTMLQKEAEFYECMQNFIAPQTGSRDYQTKNDDITFYSASRLLTIKQQIKSLEKEEKELTKDLITMCGNQNTIGRGFKLTRTLRKGAVEYSQIDELKNINLEKYRKPPVEVWRVSDD